MPEIIFGARTVSYTIRRSKRARRVKLRIAPEIGLEVILPNDRSEQEVERLLHNSQDWILKNLQRVDQLVAKTPKLQYITGECLPYLGETLTLEVIPRQRAKRSHVSRQADWLRVRLGAQPASESDQNDEVRAALEAWYRAQAKTYITARAHELATQYGYTIHKVTIRGQKTRWGSCSTRGNLNFNWRLMLTPRGAVDYVIIHELCHLTEMNHSPRFWALVEQHCPDYRYWWRWLKDHGTTLPL
ncbi:MAG: M48 family metallopeptidase [Anaerolineales bacterium]